MLWLRTGGTVWNIGGTSQGTSRAIQWNRFSGQGCLWGATRSAYGPKMLFLAVLDPFWHTQMALTDPENCSNASPGMCPDLFRPFPNCSISLEPHTCLWAKKAFFAVLEPLGALWRPRMVLPDPQNCSNASPGMCPDLFHPCSTLFHQFGATRSAYGRKRPFLAVLDPVWGPSGAPI